MPEKNARVNQNGFGANVTVRPTIPHLQQSKEDGKPFERMVRPKPEHRLWCMPEQQRGSAGKPAGEISSQYHSEREDLWGLIAPEQPG